jgi:hypothetical protein
MGLRILRAAEVAWAVVLPFCQHGKEEQMHRGLMMVALVIGCDDTTFEAHSSSGGTTESGYTGTMEVIETSCLEGCHSAASLAGGLDLETDFCGSTVGIPSLAYAAAGNLIEAGDASSSVLYLKLIAADSVGGIMPIGSPLDESSIAVVGDWIDAGAVCEDDTDTDTDTDDTDTDDTDTDDTGSDEAGYDFETVVAEIWPRCTGCHLDGGQATPTFGEDPGNLIGQMSNYYGDLTLVVPGNPEASFLYQKVRGTHDYSGGFMPPSGEPLTTEQLGMLYGWILELEQ